MNIFHRDPINTDKEGTIVQKLAVLYEHLGCTGDSPAILLRDLVKLPEISGGGKGGGAVADLDRI